MVAPNVRFPSRLIAAIDRQAADRGYDDAAQYLQDLVRHDQQRQRKRDAEQLLLDRLNRRGAVDVNARDFQRIRRRFLKQAGGNGKSRNVK